MDLQRIIDRFTDPIFIAAVASLIVTLNNLRKVKAIKEDVKLVKEDVKLVEKNTNSMREELVTEVRAAAASQGQEVGRLLARTESAIDRPPVASHVVLTDEPTKEGK